MTEKRLGRISRATLGKGGYDDAAFGFSLSFEGDGWGVGWFKGPWGLGIKPSEGAEWTEASRDEQFAEVCRKVAETLRAAKKSYLHELVGVPVEVTFIGNTLHEWRILTEVL